MIDATEIVVIGAGNIGISVAYYLFVQHGVRDMVLVDPGKSVTRPPNRRSTPISRMW